MAQVFSELILDLLDLRCTLCETQALTDFESCICKLCSHKIFGDLASCTANNLRFTNTHIGLGVWTLYAYEGLTKNLFRFLKQNPNSDLAWVWVFEVLKSQLQKYPQWKTARWVIAPKRPLQWLHINDTFFACLKILGVQNVEFLKPSYLTHQRLLSLFQSKQKRLNRKKRVEKWKTKLPFPPGLALYQTATPINPDVILFDDVVTTGATLLRLFAEHQKSVSSDLANSTNTIAFAPLWSRLQ